MNDHSVENWSYQQTIPPLDQFNQMFQEKYYNWYKKKRERSYSLLVAEVSRCKNHSLPLAKFSRYSLQKITCYSLQNSLVTRCNKSLVTRCRSCSCKKSFVTR